MKSAFAPSDFFFFGQLLIAKCQDLRYSKTVFSFSEVCVEKAIAIQMKGITKRFGEVIANKDADLDVRKGEILGLLGEN